METSQTMELHHVDIAPTSTGHTLVAILFRVRGLGLAFLHFQEHLHAWMEDGWMEKMDGGVDGDTS